MPLRWVQDMRFHSMGCVGAWWECVKSMSHWVFLTPSAHFEVSTPLWVVLRRKVLTWVRAERASQNEPLLSVTTTAQSHVFSSSASSSPAFPYHSCFSALSPIFWIPLYPVPFFGYSPFRALRMPPSFWFFHILLSIQKLLLLKLSSNFFLT